MGLFRKLRERLGRGDREKPAPPPPLPAPEGPVTASYEGHLRRVLEQLAAAGPDARAKGLAALHEPPFFAAVDALVASDRARTAIELLRRVVALAPAERSIQARLVELLCDRLEHDEAVPYLDALLDDPVHGPRARFLRAEAAERAGDLDAARRHYELLLAADIDFPKAKGRFERLRPERAVLAAAPTVAGVGGEQTRVGERYQLQRELGRGAAGAVYLALDEELGREIALKLLHPGASAQKKAEARLRAWNEARIAAALRHPGVIAVYDLDEERGLIAMELCGGGTLRDRLARGRLAPAEALRRAADLFATLEAVHRAGVLHRDLKPGNLLFRDAAPLDGEEPDLVLGDFGLADLDRARAATAAGSLPYLAPEARRGDLSQASDVYAGGVILFEMLAGAHPFDRAAILRGDARFDGVLPTALRDTLPAPGAAALTDVLAALLAPDPAGRPTPASVRESLAALLR